MVIGAVASDKSSRIAEYKRRKIRYDTQTVVAAKVEDFFSQGWSRLRDMKSGVKLQRDRSHDEILENDFWILLYLLGYRTINIGRDFKIEIAEHGGAKSRKQIPVFALDDETIVIAE